MLVEFIVQTRVATKHLLQFLLVVGTYGAVFENHWNISGIFGNLSVLLAKSDREGCVPVEHFRYFRKYFCFIQRSQTEKDIVYQGLNCMWCQEQL